jgi:hypothetical protein
VLGFGFLVLYEKNAESQHKRLGAPVSPVQNPLPFLSLPPPPKQTSAHTLISSTPSHSSCALQPKRTRRSNDNKEQKAVALVASPSLRRLFTPVVPMPVNARRSDGQVEVNPVLFLALPMPVNARHSGGQVEVNPVLFLALPMPVNPRRSDACQCPSFGWSG